MTVLFYIGGALALLLFIYLVFALLKPESF
jgi:K+-transporting ATPase KdpF subunit